MMIKKAIKLLAIVCTTTAATINCCAGAAFAWEFAEKRFEHEREIWLVEDCLKMLNAKAVFDSRHRV